jgi:hypothetical protein
LSTTHGKRKLSNYKGQIGETLAHNFLTEQGFHVSSYMFLADFSQHVNSKFKTIKTGEEFQPPSVLYVKNFLGSKVGDFIKLKEAIEREYSGREHSGRAFDFVAKKDENFYVVEVKTNRAMLSNRQKKELELSRKFGFMPMIIRTKVKIVADLKDVTMEFP